MSIARADIRVIIGKLLGVTGVKAKGEKQMPYRDVTYDNGFTERFYYDETDDEQALRMGRMNSVAKFPSTNNRSTIRENSQKETNSRLRKRQLILLHFKAFREG